MRCRCPCGAATPLLHRTSRCCHACEKLRMAQSSSTGATASTRGNAKFGSFAAAKAGERPSMCFPLVALPLPSSHSHASVVPRCSKTHHVPLNACTCEIRVLHLMWYARVHARTRVVCVCVCVCLCVCVCVFVPGLRSMAQSLAREMNAEGVHVAHVVRMNPPPSLSLSARSILFL